MKHINFTRRSALGGLFALGAASTMGSRITQAQTAPQRIVLGQSAPLTGPAAEIGLEARIGAQLLFEEVNAAGGIFNRQIELRTQDDAGNQKTLESNLKKLVEEDRVLGLFGVVGSLSIDALDMLDAAKVPVFATFSGDSGLRSRGSRYIFNLRASYADEVRTLVENLFTIGQRKFVVVYEDTQVATSAFYATQEALRERLVEAAAVVKLKPDTNDVTAALKAVSAKLPDSVIVLASYTSAAALIREARRTNMLAQLHTLSFVGGRTLSNQLGAAARGVGVTQVVPSPFSPTISVVREYQALMKKSGKSDFSFASLEGYIAAKVMVEALKRAGRDLNREKLVDAFAGLTDFDAGGFRTRFSKTSGNNAYPYVELTLIGRGGAFLK
jgi:branched-chain amino acid transport system substrate-binding protein